MQILVTLPDGFQIGLFIADAVGKAEDVDVMMRHSPGACWSPPLANDRAHERNSYHVGSW
jgi:hypothetical protein